MNIYKSHATDSVDLARELMLLRVFTVLVIFVAVAELSLCNELFELYYKMENPRGPIEGSGDEFGISMAQVGETLVVGAYREDTGAENAGAAYVFNRQGDLLRTIHNPTPAKDDWFAFEVRAVEDKIIIAARHDDTAGVDAGAVYLYDQQGELLQTIPNPSPNAEDRFGQRIAGVGDKILVSTWDDDTLGTRSGAAYLFDQDGSLLLELSSPFPHPNGQFGRSVAAIGDDRFVIGAVFGDVTGDVGAAYIFDTDGNHLATIENPNPEDSNSFGGRLTVVKDEYVLMGAIIDSSSGVEAGTAYLFDLEGNLLQTIINPTPARDDWFGRTLLGVDDQRFFIGSVFDDALETNGGAAYLYDASADLLQTILPPEPVPDGHFASEFATFDEFVAISSHFDGGGFTGPGAVYIYAPVVPLLADYNNDDVVDQADLDLVLINWGSDGTTPPDGWVSNLPTGLVDQAELDQVLINWGRTQDVEAIDASIPEPATWRLVLSLLSLAIAFQINSKVRRHSRPRK